jgi:hypothetical protein
MGYQAGMPPPIRLSDGFVPCSVDRPVQFDFQPRRGMVGVTCSVTAEDMSAFEQRMVGAFGEQQRSSDGSRRWPLGGYTVASVEVVVLGRRCGVCPSTRTDLFARVILSWVRAAGFSFAARLRNR